MPHVRSTDGVVVGVHHLAPNDGNPPLLIAHANGFHARAYAPMAAPLSGRFDVWGHDVRGNGSTVAPERWTVDWNGFGDDTLAVAEWLLDRHGQAEGSLVGFGHSLGGATLLMAALRRPGLFRALVLYEPILYPEVEPGVDLDESPLARGARRRRRDFASYREAVANFSSKPPMNAFDQAALEQYVLGGFAPLDPDDPDGPVTLRCTPEFEAATYATSHVPELWDALPDVAIPVAVVGGAPDPANLPSQLAEPIAARLPTGRYVATGFDHFGPFVHLAAVAALVDTLLS